MKNSLTNFSNLICLALTLLYGYLVFHFDSAPYFDPNFAGQDARQQLFPLYDELYPGLFGNDYVTRAMKLYTGPLHYLIASLIVKITHSPILTGHWIMCIQLASVAMFIFLTTLNLASLPAACISATWLINTRWLVRNTFGGLPRGWSGAIIAAFLFFLSRKNHTAIIILIFIGSLLHPHSTFLICATYSIYLTFKFLSPSHRAEIKKPLVRFLLFCPLIIGLNYYSVKRPEDIGTMVNLKQASQMPAFSKKGGRFPFVPLDGPVADFKHSGLNVFLDYDNKNPNSYKNRIILGLIIFYIAAILIQLKKGKEIFPIELRVFPLAILITYFLARILAFRLYVPIRYIGWPFSIFFIISIPVIIWRTFHVKNENRVYALAASAVLVIGIYLSAGSNLGNTSNYKEGQGYDNKMYTWIRENTPQTAVFAGHPSAIDGMQLYGMRRAYITTETAHPFYDKYNEVIEQRIKNSFLAFFAKNSADLLAAFKNDKIDYFVFSKKYFKGEESGYYQPHDNMVRKLSSAPPDDYLYGKLLKNPSSIVYQSDDELIVELSKLNTVN